MDMTRNMLRKLIAAVAIIAVLTGTASAQSPFTPSLSLGGDTKRKLTPEEQAKQNAIDQAYKSATAKIPDRKSNDPWADVRPASPAPSPKKKPQ